MREVNRAHNEKLWVWKERRHAQSAARRAAKERGGGGGLDTHTKFECSNEEKEEGELSLAPMSPPCVTLPLFSDIASRQVAIMVRKCWPK
jgi:hypothetical protein